MPSLGKRLLTAGLAGVVIAGGGTAPALAGPANVRATAAASAKRPVSDTTSARERRRVDRVKTPQLDWYKCYDYAECATTRLPLDYDKPNGATTEIAVLRVKARDQKHKIGSLFLNPGGPGGSGTEMALFAPYFLTDALLQRFDIVGVDPRGVAASTNVRCWKSVKDQTAVLDKMNVAFPWGAKEESAYVSAAKKFGRACSTTGRPLTGAMSTAEVARDMDVVRRAVGDRKLTYLGFSYGSALGQYYANMFPDRFRAIVIDGVLDAQRWTGTRRTANQLLDQRLRSADGAYRALREILRRCDAAGERYCVFAAGDPVKRLEFIAQQLRRKPLVITDEYGTYTITYADFVGGMLGSLYGVDAGDAVTYLAKYLWDLLAAPTTANQAARATAKAALLKRITGSDGKRRYDFPYDNGLEAFSGVVCTDGLHPRDAGRWPALAARADRRAPYFGRLWGWIDAQCARNTWTVRDEDAYTGPWTRRTGAPVLVVGTRWDPATNYDGAVSASRRLPNSRLLSNTNWGHTSYGTSACVTGAIERYLLTVALPARGTVCEGDYQPFTQPLPTDPGAAATKAAAAERARPPVATPLPPSVLNGNR